MKRYLRNGLAILICTTVCFQSPLVALADDNMNDASVAEKMNDTTVYQKTDYEIVLQSQNSAQWMYDKNGWYYKNADGSYPKNQWKQINGNWYYFNLNGYMQTGWLQLNENRYYLNSNGVMQTGWMQLENTWYYLKSNGVMAINEWIGTSYVDANGEYIPEKSNGIWKKDKTGWWYQNSNGSYPMNQWKYISGQWYWFNINGYMVTGWQHIDNTWYYLQNSGALATNKWIGNYYVESTGAMATNKWIGNYYVDASGLWTQTRQIPKWIQNGNRWWYRHADGSYTRNGWEMINNKDYLFDDSGWMLTGWQNVNGSWYYLNNSGEKITNTWISNKYYLKSDGVMATNEWVDNGKYYVDSNGVWNKNIESEIITNAALAWIALDEDSMQYHKNTAGIKEVYIDQNGNYQIYYSSGLYSYWATATLTFAPLHTHIYYRTLPSGYSLEICSWINDYKPSFESVKQLDVSKIALAKAELKNENRYTISQ